VFKVQSVPNTNDNAFEKIGKTTLTRFNGHL